MFSGANFADDDYPQETRERRQERTRPWIHPWAKAVFGTAYDR